MITISKLSNYKDWTLLVVRFAIAAIFIYHGIDKLNMWSAVAGPSLPVWQLYLMRFLSIVEPLGGLGLMIGLLTQYAAMGYLLIMLGAIVLKLVKWHGVFLSGPGVSGWDFDLTLVVTCLVLIVFGAGVYSFDSLLAQRKQE